MKDNEIIKVLECCNNEGCCDEKCPYYTQEFKGKANCLDEKEGLVAKALDLINRQKAEIERSKEEVRLAHNVIKRTFLLKAGLMNDPFAEIKAEARKEFAERVEYFALNEDPEINDSKCKDYESYMNGFNQFRFQIKNGINNLLAEMESERE